MVAYRANEFAEITRCRDLPISFAADAVDCLFRPILHLAIGLRIKEFVDPFVVSKHIEAKKGGIYAVFFPDVRRIQIKLTLVGMQVFHQRLHGL